MNESSDIRNMLIESATRLFADHVDANLMAAARRDGWSAALWEVIESAELSRISIPEAAGGAGGSVSDLAVVLRIAGRYTAPVPLAETALIGNWMLAASGLPVERAALGVAASAELAATQRGDALIVSGVLERVPWARIASRLVVLVHREDQSLVAVVDPAHCTIEPGSNLAAEPRDRVRLDKVAALTHAPAGASVTHDAFRLRSALGRALLTAGALERALELAVEYAKTRVQFGRRIGEFQAIQQELARAAGEVAAAVAASLSAAGAVDRGQHASLAVAAARIRSAEAAREVALIAHQVHGAIGVTDEYALHHVTLRLWAWREEFGNEAVWAIELGRAMQSEGAAGFWPALSAE